MHESDAEKNPPYLGHTAPHHATPHQTNRHQAMLCYAARVVPPQAIHACMHARTHAAIEAAIRMPKPAPSPFLPFHSLSTGPTPIPITSHHIVYHSLSLALPVGPPPPPCCASSPSRSTSSTSSPASMANSAFCSVARSSVLRGSTSSEGFSLALLRILFVPQQN